MHPAVPSFCGFPHKTCVKPQTINYKGVWMVTLAQLKRMETTQNHVLGFLNPPGGF